MFYEQFCALCEENGEKPTSVARKLGLSSSAPSYWRKGSVPQSDTLQKIADYFGVSTDSLLRSDANNYTAAEISGSVVLQGSNDNHVNNGETSPKFEDLDDMETELIRIYRDLPPRLKNFLLSYAYQIEDRVQEQKTGKAVRSPAPKLGSLDTLISNATARSAFAKETASQEIKQAAEKENDK